MSNELVKVFENEEFGSVRTEVINGKPYFCGKDIAGCLGYTNPQKALRDHCLEKGVTIRSALTKGGEQQLKFISEGNVYRLISHSKLPNAERFESWVFDEVLPSIRKTGSYSTPMTKEQIVQQALLIVNEELNKTKQELATAKPLAEYTTKVLDTSSCFTTTDIAKSMGMSARQLNQILADKGVQYKQSGSWYLYAHYQGLGLTKTATFLINEDDDNSYTAHSMKWTEKGRKFIYDLMKDKENIA